MVLTWCSVTPKCLPASQPTVYYSYGKKSFKPPSCDVSPPSALLPVSSHSSTHAVLTTSGRWRHYDNLSNWPTYCKNSCFIIRLLYASTCFGHCVLIIRGSKLNYTASGIITPVGGLLVHNLREDYARDGHLQVWWYHMLYNTILTPRRWAHNARNM